MIASTVSGEGVGEELLVVEARMGVVCCEPGMVGGKGGRVNDFQRLGKASERSGKARDWKRRGKKRRLTEPCREDRFLRSLDQRASSTSSLHPSKPP